jgi:pseudouridine kinase
MKLAICDADIVEKINIEYIKSKSYILSNSKILILDTGLTGDVIEYIVNNFRNVPVFLDPVSIKRSRKIKKILSFFDTLKLNRHEAEYLSGMVIRNREDLEKAGEFFMNEGVKNVFITLSKDGVFYRSAEKSGFLASPDVHVVNATGAGDAFMAGIVYSRLSGLNMYESAIFSTGASIVALSHENTINPNISVENIQNKIKELGIC